MRTRELSLRWWADNSGGRLLGGSGDSLCERIGTDTRADLGGSLFVALRGDNFDGHDYLEQAAESGAIGLLFEPLPDVELGLLRSRYPQVGLIEVDDSAIAFSRLARAWRLYKNPYVVALTGSVGKTTTRDLIASALSESFHVHQTKANLNNIIGVPQSVFAMPEDTELAVFELGMHIPGEISRSSLCTVPDMAIITNIGTSHIGNFEDGQEGILRAKAEIAEGLKDGGTLLINGDDEQLRKLVPSMKNRFNIVFTHADSDMMGMEASVYASARESLSGQSEGRIYTARDIDLTGLYASYTLVRETVAEDGTVQSVELGRMVSPAPGQHHVMNTLTAFACAAELGVGPETANRAIGSFTPTGYRQRVSEYGPYTVINDSYNASPESMQSAFGLLDRLADDRSGRALVALGCMAEQGSAAEDLHLQVGRDLGRHAIDHAYVLGPEARFIAAGAHETSPKLIVSCYDDRSELLEALLQDLEVGDHILVKGSRMYAMERVAEGIKEFVDSRSAADPDIVSESEE